MREQFKEPVEDERRELLESLWESINAPLNDENYEQYGRADKLWAAEFKASLQDLIIMGERGISGDCPSGLELYEKKIVRQIERRGEKCLVFTDSFIQDFFKEKFGYNTPRGKLLLAFQRATEPRRYRR